MNVVITKRVNIIVNMIKSIDKHNILFLLLILFLKYKYIIIKINNEYDAPSIQSKFAILAFIEG